VVVFVNDWQWGSYYLPFKNEASFGERDWHFGALL
jgi:hypothetical protein